MGVSLPPKEANLFKLIVKSYETKQYKKGLKAADSILKKFPNHGETLSMKGLTLNCMDRKSEAYDLVRLGLKNDLKSHVCWHVYGLLYRSDRNYREAIKCYRNALRIDPDNLEILRDLSLLQAQMRDLEGFVETRQQLLTLKPSQRMNWIGFAVAQHLNSNASKAVDILEAYEGTLDDNHPPENERCEHGEMLLYKISLLEECSLIEKALEELHKKRSKIVDKLSFKEVEVSLLVKLGRLDEGEKLYRLLVSTNPDNYRYYEGLQKCLGLHSENAQYSSSEVDQLEALYQSLALQYSWSSAAKRIPLDFLTGDKFREAADNYMRPLLTKGVPSLFSDLSPLYDQPEKADILEELALGLEHSLKTSGGYPGRVDTEPPSTLMWILLYLAQNYDRRGHYDIALAKIDEAITHTPTVIESYSIKSRILKHGGDLEAAAGLADEARCMDLSDRHANRSCVKRMLQADQVTLAEKTAALFTKDWDLSLQDMQCMWYELASGESFFRQGDLGRALKKFLAVEKHYADITEDQFDFHTYCLRKMTLRGYIEMLKYQDRLHSHTYFRKAAAGAIRCYIKLYDAPLKSAAKEDDMSNLPASQKKKNRQKQRKAEARAKKAEVKTEESSANVSKAGMRHVKPVDPDPHGEKLLQVEDPLLEAAKYLNLLQKHSPDSLETHLLSFEVYMRKHKILLALQALKHLLRLDAEKPDSHRCMIRFFYKVASIPTPVSEAEKLIWSVLEAEQPTFSQLHGKSLVEANTLFLEKHKDSLMHRAAAAEMLHLLEPKRKADAIKIIEESSNNPVPKCGSGVVKEWKLKDCIAVHKILGTIFDDHATASRWKVRCSKYFPYSTYFEGGQSSVVTRNRVKDNTVNGGMNHLETDQNAVSLSTNGKLENVEKSTTFTHTFSRGGYPLCLKLIDARDESELTLRLSKKASLHELHERVCSLKRTDTGKVRIWDYFNNQKQTLLEDSTKTLEESDLQMNQSILLEVQVDGIYEATVDDISMKVLVTVSFLDEPFNLEGLKPSDTVHIVKNRVNNLVFKERIREKFFPLHPASREMVSSDGVVFEDDRTLESISESCFSNDIIMHYINMDLEGTAELEEEFHFLGLTKSARFIEEPHEEDYFIQPWCSEDEDKNEDKKEGENEDEDGDEDEDEKSKHVSIVKRPKTNHGPLPSIDSGGPDINGSYQLFNSKNKIIPLPKFKFAVSIKTTAHVILLAPNPEIFNHLLFLNGKSETEYLVLHVFWDRLSYFFLRTLRTSYPSIPIVAVTDLDPHHLDLLTFLDTPPDDLPACYGWDLIKDSDDETETVLVNIKWLGLCPNDCEGLHFDDDARSAQPGFEEVIRMLRVNPHLRRKEDWLAALDWLDLYGKSVSFGLGGDFISRKLSNEDWV